MKWIFNALLLLATPAHAQDVIRKCVDAKGHASFQNAVCPADSQEVKALAYTPEAAPTHEQQRARALADRKRKQEADNLARMAGRGHRAQGRRVSSAGTVIPIENPGNVARCNVAKAQRQRQLDAMGLNRNYDRLSRLDAMVREACK